eukprot:m.352055 g.352055  ORF g.352055 m.352055 type:complete len:286 (-) comp16428_c0_seq1:130-987(-)
MLSCVVRGGASVMAFTTALTCTALLPSRAQFANLLPARHFWTTSNMATMVTKEEALPGSDEAVQVNPEHFVLKTKQTPPFPSNMEVAVLGTGCFWGSERVIYKRVPGIFATSVGYAGGFTNNPTYKQVCTGMTGHTEVVQVVYDPVKVSFADLMKPFWESHDPTQGNRQGPDAGTQYRSAIYCTTEAQRVVAEASKAAYGKALVANGHTAPITTEIKMGVPFFYAEDYHQQYLDKPGNRQYCGAAPTGIDLPPPSSWDLPDDVKESVTENPEVWGRTFAGCVFGP